MQGGDVVQQKAQRAPVLGVLKAFRRDRLSVLVVDNRPEVALNRAIRHRLCTQVGKDSQCVELAGRFHNSGDHQVPEHRSGQHTETQAVIDRGDRLVQQLRTGGHRAAWSGRGRLGFGRRGEQPCAATLGDVGDRFGARGHLEPEVLLIADGQRPCPFQQNAQLSLWSRSFDYLRFNDVAGRQLPLAVSLQKQGF